VRLSGGFAALVLVVTGCGSAGQPGVTGSVASSTPPDGSLYAVTMGACLEKAGYTVEVTDDGGIGVQFAPDDASAAQKQALKSAYDTAYEVCLHETGFDYVPSVDPEEEFRQLMAQDECLRQHGIPVSSPTYEEFLQGQYSDWDAVPTDPTRLAELKEACGI